MAALACGRAGAETTAEHADIIVARLRDAGRMAEPKDYTSWREQFTALESAAENGHYCENWDLPDGQLAKLRLSWPGPNTWLVPHQGRLPAWITGAHDTVALRVTTHPIVRQLCAVAGPLVSTSANPAGRPSARSRLRVEQYFHGELDAIVPGALGGARNPSIIRDLQTDQVIRGA